VKLLTVEADLPLPDVPAPTVGEQWVLVRLHGEPLGILQFVDHGCTRTELASLITRRFAKRILRHRAADNLVSGTRAFLNSHHGTCPQPSAASLPHVSVAVCSRNGAGRLAECLDALVRLDYPSDRLDVMVVDNAPSDDATRRLVESRYPSIRYLVEARPGLDRARNRAILEAAGEIVAFTDDDVSVDSRWVRAMADVFASDPDVDAVTGLVVPDEIDCDAQRLFEEYGGFSRGFDRHYFRVDQISRERAATRHGGAGRFGTGANMAFRRKIFDRIGVFDPALDVGTPANGGGDLEMFFRVLKEGGTLVYEPSAIVRHRHRRTYEALRTQLANNGIGFYAYLVRSARAYPDERGAFFRLGAWWFWWWNVRRLARSIVRPSEFPRDLILAEFFGSLAGLRRYSRARDVASS
jgi:O-antigen biosynthesis protein